MNIAPRDDAGDPRLRPRRGRREGTDGSPHLREAGVDAARIRSQVRAGGAEVFLRLAEAEEEAGRILEDARQAARLQAAVILDEARRAAHEEAAAVLAEAERHASQVRRRAVEEGRRLAVAERARVVEEALAQGSREATRIVSEARALAARRFGAQAGATADAS